MISDRIHVTNDGAGVEEALRQAELVAAYRALPKKQALHLRLLTEEMMGMMQALTGQRAAEFWIEDKDGASYLNLKMETVVNSELREKLLAASTSKSNTAAKGVMGKIRDLFERLLEPLDAQTPSGAAFILPAAGADVPESYMAMQSVWSLNQYRVAAENGNLPKEDWDELERSLVAKLADEVNVGIADDTVEMVITKKH